MQKELREQRRKDRTVDHGDYVSIATSRGDLMVSKKDYPKIKDYTWMCNKNKVGNLIAYAKVTDPETGEVKIVYPHWLIYGENNDFYFLNRNPLDIRRENVVAGDFPVKIRGYKRTAGQFVNVRVTPAGRYNALFRVPEGKVEYLGTFKTEREAAEKILATIRERFPEKAGKTIKAIKKIFAYDSPEKAMKWGWVD